MVDQYGSLSCNLELLPGRVGGYRLRFPIHLVAREHVSGAAPQLGRPPARTGAACLKHATLLLMPLLLDRPGVAGGTGRPVRRNNGPVRYGVSVTSILVPLLFAACTEPAAVKAGRAQPYADGVTLRDTSGRELRLHGFNARVEGLFDVTFDDGRIPLETIPPFGDADCAFIADELGMNLLRLPVNWSGMEPEDDRFDEAYFDRVTAVVDACWTHGVYTQLDIHQDAYSKEIGEDGAPLWAIVPAPAELLEGPLEDLEARRTSGPVLAAFRSLYTNQAGLFDAYGDMAGELAGRFVDHPGIVGIELHNEPVALGDQASLDAFHEAVALAVRDRAPSMAIHFEPDAFRNLTDSAPVTNPFPLGNVVYAPHVYTDVFEDGWASLDTGAIEASVAAAREEATAHDAPLLVGEFGHDPETEAGRAYIAAALESFDAYSASWAFWVYEEWSQGRWGLYGGDTESRGPLRDELADLLTRPFPAAVDGKVTHVAWDGAALTVGLDGAGDGEHLVSAPSRVWPGEVVVQCDGQQVDATRVGGRVRFRCGGGEVVVAGE